MFDLLTYSFFQNALIGTVFASITCGIIGTYIVSRRLVFISGGVTHASFGGLGLGFYLGVNPVFSALVFALATALGVEWVSKKKGVREDSAIAATWSLGMAIGIIFIFLTPGYVPGLNSYLFGNILTISRLDLWMMGICALLITILFLLYHREIFYTAFDRDFAITQQIPVRFIEYGMMVLVALAVVLTIRMVGIMLLLSVLTVPQLTAGLFTSNYKKILIGSIGICFAGCLIGLYLSYLFNVPSGAFIVFTLTASYLLCYLVLKLTKRTTQNTIKR